MKLNITAIFALLILSIFIAACGGPVANNAPANNINVPKATSNNPLAVVTPTPPATTNAAPTLTAVYKAYCEAMIKRDEAGIRKSYSTDTLKNFESQMKANKITSLLKFLEDDAPVGTCSVKNEEINGDRATADIVSGSYPNGIKIVFVKENGEWKMTNQSPSIDSVKPTGAKPATK